MNKNKIYVMLLVSLISSQLCYSAEQPAWLNEANDAVHGNLDGRIDLTDSSLALDPAPIEELQCQLHRYRDYDQHLKNLDEALSTKKEQINKYNSFINNAFLPDDEKETLKSDAVIQALKVSPNDLERLKKLSSIIVQTKNLDPFWQFKEQGYFWGICSFAKNLFIPRDWQSYLYAGTGALIGLGVLKPSPKTTIQINLPVDASKVTINDNAQQKLITTAALCVLGAGGLVAGTQLYNSWMYENDTRAALTDKIDSIISRNLTVHNTFQQVSLAMNAAVNASANQAAHAASQRAIDGVRNNIGVVQNGILAVQNGVVSVGRRIDQQGRENRQRHNALHANVTHVKSTTEAVQADVQQLKADNRAMNAKLDEIATSQGLNTVETVKLKQAVERSGDNAQVLFESIQSDLNDVKGMAVANAVLQMQIHKENTNNLRSLSQRISLSNNQQSISNSSSSSSQPQATVTYSGPSFLHGTALGRAMASQAGASHIQRPLFLSNDSSIEEVD